MKGPSGIRRLALFRAMSARDVGRLECTETSNAFVRSALPWRRRTAIRRGDAALIDRTTGVGRTTFSVGTEPLAAVYAARARRALFATRLERSKTSNVSAFKLLAAQIERRIADVAALADGERRHPQLFCDVDQRVARFDVAV